MNVLLFSEYPTALATYRRIYSILYGSGRLQAAPHPVASASSGAAHYLYYRVFLASMQGAC